MAEHLDTPNALLGRGEFSKAAAFNQLRTENTMSGNAPSNNTTIIYGPRGDILVGPKVVTNRPEGMLSKVWRLLTRS